MGRDIDGANGIECSSHIRDRVRDDFPLEAELATEDGRELIQNLNADHATRENHLPRHLTLVLPALGVDQNIRVEGTPSSGVGLVPIEPIAFGHGPSARAASVRLPAIGAHLLR